MTKKATGPYDTIGYLTILTCAEPVYSLPHVDAEN